MTSTPKNPDNSAQDEVARQREEAAAPDDALVIEEAADAEESSSLSSNEAFYQARSRTRQRFVLAMATLTGAAVMASMAALSVLPSSPAPDKLPAPLVTAHPTELLLGCLDATIDPFNPLGSEVGDAKARSAAATLWAPTTVTEVEFLRGAKVSTEPPTRVDGTSWGLKAKVTHSAADANDTADGTSSELPHAASIVGQKGGELRGLSILPCTPPTLEHWFAVGSTSIGEDMVIRVANTGSQPSVVTLSAWGASGPLDQLSQSHVVAAGETLSIQPGRYFLNEERLLLRLNADGPGVSAWLHTSAMAGEAPQGSAWIASTVPSSRQVIPGLTAGVEHSLRLAVPPMSQTNADKDDAGLEAGSAEEGEGFAGAAPSQEDHSDIEQSGEAQSSPVQSDAEQSDTAQSGGPQSDAPQSDALQSGPDQAVPDTGNVEVTLRVLDANGTRDIPGGALTLAENSVLDISLPEVSDTSSLIIGASSPVVAQVLTRYPGTQWPSASGQAALNAAGSGSQHWQGRGALTASSGVEGIHIPAASDIDAAVTEAFEATVVRPTSVTTPAQASPAGYDLVLVNPTDTDRSIRYGDVEKTIPAGTSITMPLADTAATLNSSEAVHAAIIVRAELPTGNIDAVWPLGSISLNGLTRALDLR